MSLRPSAGSVRTFDDGSGPALYAGGPMHIYGAPPYYIYSVARWNGRQWFMMSDGLPQQGASPDLFIRVLNLGSGPRLHAFGRYFAVGSSQWVHWNVIWTGSGWQPGPPGLVAQDTAPETTLDFGSGPTTLGVVVARPGYSGIARWTGTSWVVFGEPNSSIGNLYRFIVFDDGAGPALYVGGVGSMNGVPTPGVAKWDGSAWSSLGSGVSMAVRDMAVYDDGSGPALYVVGQGTQTGGVPIRNIAKWNGQQWSDVGGGTGGCTGCPSVLYSAEVFDDGRGPALYVGGYVTQVGNISVRGIARWDGHAWSALGAGTAGSYLDEMVVFDDGRGPSLFISDTYEAGGGVVPGIAQWVGCPNCYPDCDNDGQANVSDFVCFLNKYALRDPYTNCTVDATIDAADFICYMNRYAQGCP